MSTVSQLDDKRLIEIFLRNDELLHLYEIGDLDPFFWPHTRWHGLVDEGGQLRALALFYRPEPPEMLPTLLALERRDLDALKHLLEELACTLPVRFYAHLSPDAASSLVAWRPDGKGRFLKMGLTHPQEVRRTETPGVEQLTIEQVDEVEDFYAHSYPGNWFDPRMLETESYFGIRERGRLICVAGTHVVSPHYRVAALGNIATAPTHRGRGLARAATARVCQALLESVGTIGLNVKADNEAAIACYRQLGFEVVAEYEEFMMEPRQSANSANPTG